MLDIHGTIVVRKGDRRIRNTSELVVANRSQQEKIRRRELREASLRESEESLATTLHSIGGAVMATDADGRVSRMNPTAERMTGWRLGEARGHLLPALFRIVNADPRRTVANRVELVMQRGEVVGLANHTVLLVRDGSATSTSISRRSEAPSSPA